MSITIALAGNPNCGKTTLFNELTGSNQYVGNWPGVTVEKKEGRHKADKDLHIVDLPGIYSLSPYSPEEVVSRDFLIDARPDVVVNLVDATNLQRNLYLTTQVASLGLPMVVALNMTDVVRKQGDKLDAKLLAERLGCPVVEISALKGEGLDELVETVRKTAESHVPAAPAFAWSEGVADALDELEAVLTGSVPAGLERWYAVKLLEGEQRTIDAIEPDEAVLALAAAKRAGIEAAEDDDIESVVAAERYAQVADLAAGVLERSSGAESLSQKVDRIVTNRFLGIPIFIVVMFFVYFVSVSTMGKLATDWANDGVFGDGWLYTNRAAYEQASETYDAAKGKVEAFVEAAQARGIDTEAFTEAREAEEPTAEQEKAVDEFKETISKENVTATVEEGDETVALTPKDFDEAVSVEKPEEKDFGLYIPGIPTYVGEWLDSMGTAPWMKGLLVDGILAGVGAVLGFIPQLFILFIFLSILESCGYLARVAFIMDRIFRRFGLSGKSFIPMLIASGCGVPAVMATKAIENEKDRRMTIMTTTMIPCGAKLPIIALVFGALAGREAAGTWWVAPLFYFLGIAAIVVSGIMLKKTKAFAGDPAPFVMELPRYHVPAFKTVAISVWERIRSYAVKAGTVIFLSTIVIWFLMNFGMVEGAFGMLDNEVEGYLDSSIMAGLGTILAPLFAPLGFDGWQATVTSITGLVAKENVVATVGILTKLGELGETDPNMWAGFAGMLGGSAPAIVAFCAFNLLCAPCFAAIGTIRRQMASAKWTWFAIGYMTVFAWVVALIIYQAWVFAAGGGFTVWTAVAAVLAAGMLFQLFRPMPKYDSAADKSGSDDKGEGGSGAPELAEPATEAARS